MILSFVDPETYNRNQNSFKNCYWNELRLWPLKQKQHSNQTQMVSIFGLIGIKEKWYKYLFPKKKIIFTFDEKKNWNWSAFVWCCYLLYSMNWPLNLSVLSFCVCNWEMKMSWYRRKLPFLIDLISLDEFRKCYKRVSVCSRVRGDKLWIFSFAIHELSVHNGSKPHKLAGYFLIKFF